MTHAWQKLPTDRLDIDFIERRRVGLEVCCLSYSSNLCLQWSNFSQSERDDDDDDDDNNGDDDINST